MTDRDYMEQCIALAREAEQLDEVPVGALVVCRGQQAMTTSISHIAAAAGSRSATWSATRRSASRR